MTRRNLIATLLAAILAPFRRAKAAPVVTADYWRDRMQEALDHQRGEWKRVENDWRPSSGRFINDRGQACETVRYVFKSRSCGPSERAIFGLCPKCGGLQCRCD